MKKLILTSLALAVGATLGYSQGAITITSTSAGFLISTNGASISEATGGAGTGLNSYYYAVLASAYGGSAPSTANQALATSTWTYTGVIAPNNTTTKGGVGVVNTTTSAAGTFGLPTGSSYSTAPTEYYVIVGWSANEGTSWAAVENELSNNTLVVGGWFGVSPLAYNEAGGANSLGTVNLLNGGSGATQLAGSGLTSGFDLYPVTAPAPEPTTIALGAVGAASLLALRRKKA